MRLRCAWSQPLYPSVPGPFFPRPLILPAPSHPSRALAPFFRPHPSQEIAAIECILWFSAIFSAVLDNIPYTIAMLPVIQQMADESPQLSLTVRQQLRAGRAGSRGQAERQLWAGARRTGKPAVEKTVLLVPDEGVRRKALPGQVQQLALRGQGWHGARGRGKGRGWEHWCGLGSGKLVAFWGSMRCSPPARPAWRRSFCASAPSCLKPAASSVAGAGVGAGIRRLPRRQRYADWRVRQHRHVGRSGSRRLPHQLLQLAVCGRSHPAGVGGSGQRVHAAALLHISPGLPHELYPPC